MRRSEHWTRKQLCFQSNQAHKLTAFPMNAQATNDPCIYLRNLAKLASSHISRSVALWLSELQKYSEYALCSLSVWRHQYSPPTAAIFVSIIFWHAYKSKYPSRNKVTWVRVARNCAQTSQIELCDTHKCVTYLICIHDFIDCTINGGLGVLLLGNWSSKPTAGHIPKSVTKFIRTISAQRGHHISARHIPALTACATLFWFGSPIVGSTN